MSTTTHPSTVRPRRPLVDIIAGARPNFMKIAPILEGLHLGQWAS